MSASRMIRKLNKMNEFTYQKVTAVCSPDAMNMMAFPVYPKLQAKTFSNAMHKRPSGAAVVGLANSSLTTGKAIMILPTRKLANMNAIVLHR